MKISIYKGKDFFPEKNDGREQRGLGHDIKSATPESNYQAIDV